MIRTPPNKCSACGSDLDAASVVKGEERPSEGDLTMCFYCGTIHAFTADLKLRPLSAEEFVALDVDTRSLLKRMQRTRTSFAEKMKS